MHIYCSCWSCSMQNLLYYDNVYILFIFFSRYCPGNFVHGIMKNFCLELSLHLRYESLLCSVFCLWSWVILLGVRMFHMIHCLFFTFIPGDFYDLAVCNHAVNFWNMPGCRLISWFMPHGCVRAPIVEVLLLWWHQRIYKQIVIRKKLVVEKFYAINCQPIQFCVSFIVPLVEGPIEYSMSF